jgi:hypothetical protein
LIEIGRLLREQGLSGENQEGECDKQLFHFATAVFAGASKSVGEIDAPTSTDAKTISAIFWLSAYMATLRGIITPETLW